MKDDRTSSLGNSVGKAVEAAEEVVQRPLVKKFARFGFYAKGLLFIIVGALSILLAVGSPEGQIADAAGAMSILSHQRFGKVLLVIFIFGALGHAVWNILRAVADVDNAGSNWLGRFRRSIAAGIGIVYIGLAITAAEIVLAAREAELSSQAEETFVAVLLAIPYLGAVLLFLIGLGVVGAGIHELFSGLTGRFRDTYRSWEITETHFAIITVLGILAFSARAVILCIMGYFLIAAAIWAGANGSIGLDAALFALSQNSYGRVFLFAAATGLFAHGVLAFYEAKYRRLC